MWQVQAQFSVLGAIGGFGSVPSAKKAPGTETVLLLDLRDQPGKQSGDEGLVEEQQEEERVVERGGEAAGEALQAEKAPVRSFFVRCVSDGAAPVWV
jgi:hypothetical protein